VLLFKSRKRAPNRVGNYEILSQLGDGGMAEVFKARHRVTGRVVAIKILKTNLAADPRLAQRFEQEYTAASRLRHPHAIETIEFGHEGGTPFLVLEYVDGTNLWDEIFRQGQMPEPDAVRITVQVAEALHEAHEVGLVHRDVKPDNILLTADGSPKLADLGLVKDLENNLDLTCPNQGLGTPNFAAVEQFDDAKNADPRCDIYGLGATLYMMVTGKLPFASHNLATTLKMKAENRLIPPRQFRPLLSDRLNWTIRRAVRANPDERPASCLEFIGDLTGVTPRPARPEFAAPEVHLRESERRASIRYATDLASVCHPIGGDLAANWQARVRNVSATGLCLLSPRRFERGTVLAVDLRVTPKGPIQQLLVRIVRVEQADGRQWLLGAAFTTRRTDPEVKELRGKE
jgi:serine/threonine protein kinase